ncbi:hypothetical protein ACPEEZ_12810 [Frigoribacterium sp. 2-23]|uniref:hypothetical protein n=1 Tax=Frigoribacterium sp. 2-23 TaxID=3415006 RepID=UPI003C6EC52C
MTNDPDDVATQLGLAVVAHAAALNSGDTESLVSAEDNLRDTVDGLIDEPMTHRQELVVESLAATGGALTAGLSSALAAEQGRPADEILQKAAGSIVNQREDDAAH